MTEEERRLEEERHRVKNWKRWGPYLSERQWSTVREDYSPEGRSWEYFPFEHAMSRAYRWGEDGILGITDRECRLCFALSFWNGEDPFLKERLFGLVPGQGNHGEDVKECYYYLDSTPTHSYMKALYKYPQRAFPYDHLIVENQKRGLENPEFELLETGIFNNNEYFDIFVEYGKNSPDDILIRVTIANRSQKGATLHFIPTLWYRNTWAWGCAYEGCTSKQLMHLQDEGVVTGRHETLGKFYFYYANPTQATPLFTENETNLHKLYGVENKTPYVKDAFHTYIVHNIKESVNPHLAGSKFGAQYTIDFQKNETKTFCFRLACGEPISEPFDHRFDAIFEKRQQESKDFHTQNVSDALSQEEKGVITQAAAGLLWTKQFYHYVVEDWLKGDPLQPAPPATRYYGRNIEWPHLFCRDVISVPDKWEYPWFAAWDLAFHVVSFAKFDPDFAKNQIILFLREWYQHPNGQQPAYEYEFSDVNPPVHAWAAWRVYKMTAARGERDLPFLESAFQKLLLNFTWWVNKKDREGNNLFSGGFLGLDNIGVIDRSKLKSSSTFLEQADGTAWMACYCLTMLSISLELAIHNPAYEDMASKFFEHFVYIADSINKFGGSGLWDEQDGFYYDILKHDGKQSFIRTRSLVGLLPLVAVEILEESHIEKLEGFSKRMAWFLRHRKDLENAITYCDVNAQHGLRLLAIPSKKRLSRILHYLFDENEFLSPFGIRSLSKFHEKNPLKLQIGSEEHCINYEPGTSNSGMFGGNSNWRGPIWFPLNFLIIEALERYDHYYGPNFTVEYPTGSSNRITLKQAADDLSDRLISLFMPDASGCRPCFGSQELYAKDPYWQHLLQFHEYFHAETGEGLGASHQTGWTALVARLLQAKSKRLQEPFKIK